MVDNWLKATDGTGSTIRTLLFDYRKAFDLINSNVLVNKICLLGLPHSIVNWILDFLSNQRVKLSSSCYSEWGAVPSGIPQGTKLGLYLFFIMINDLEVHETSLWKFVDDTTASEIVSKGQLSSAQANADKVVGWSHRNRLKLNPDKCKEIRISFSKHSPDFTPVQVDNQSLEVVKQAKFARSYL